MRIILVSPHSPVFSTRIGIGNQIPLGLLSIGGPLSDAGHQVSLLDVDAHGFSRREASEQIFATKPDLIMIGHSGSTTAHPESMALARIIKRHLPNIPIVYGGVYPTYHARSILKADPVVDIIVRGEGERTASLVANALENSLSLADIQGVTFMDGNKIIETKNAPLIENLDEYRTGWELIKNWDLYQCWGVGRAAAIQISRGCPHQCSYCGQNGFWQRWRRRDPVKIVDQIELLYRNHGIRFINIADENPAVSRKAWRQFLEELCRRNLPMSLFCGMRAADIVRDADLLPLYRKAGIVCVNLGIETTDPKTIRLIRKGSSVADDYRALFLLRQNKILSMAGHVIGFQADDKIGFLDTLRSLYAYNPDFLNALHATPHSWTPFARESMARSVVQTDLGRWDYRHQVLAVEDLTHWQTFFWVKGLEMVYHLRPTALWRLLLHPDRRFRLGLRWCYFRMARVWLAEIGDFILHLRFEPNPKTLDSFLQNPTNQQDIRPAKHNAPLSMKVLKGT
ncbi:MAG: cobalamin-dependent protein [Magnetococcales bacterium]|nr:cobalamin-dependent protein [Magnetococcales bacterium]